MFVFFNDPEGPNLLVVMVMAVVIYFLSLVIYSFNFSAKNLFRNFSLLSFASFNNVLTVILIQVITVTVLYFCLS